MSDSISDVSAAQFIVNLWTVYGMLTDLKVPKGEYVLQTAAASVLGRQPYNLQNIGASKLSPLYGARNKRRS